MKNPIRTLCVLLALGASPLVAQAQPPLKLLVVDMVKLYDTHWEAIDQKAKIQADDERAKEEVTKLNTEGNVLVGEYTALNEQANNPALTPAAKEKAQADAQKKYQAVMQKKQEVEVFVQNTQRSMQQRMQNFNSMMLEKISKIAADVGKKKGATLVLDKAGSTIIGVSNVIYFDPAYDITDDVAKELALSRPANMPEPKAPTAAPSGTPQLMVPGITPKK
ncbi:MAG: OmpH family outer membrane protein [Opitutaceae bacterium]